MTPKTMVAWVRSGRRFLLAAVACMGHALAADPTPAEVSAAFPSGDGLAVQVGASDPGFLGALTNAGKRLLHGLTLDDATRDKARAGLMAAHLHPLASVSTWYGAPRLPYADCSRPPSSLADPVSLELRG
jgi:hypothetical protein